MSTSIQLTAGNLKINGNDPYSVNEQYFPIGSVGWFAGTGASGNTGVAPIVQGFLVCDGATYNGNSVAYAPLLAKLGQLYGVISGVATLTLANPCVITYTQTWSHGHAFKLTTSGALPSSLVSGTTYYARVVNGTTFNACPTYADAIAGTNIISTLSLSQSGTHTLTDLSNFKVPDMRGLPILGIGTNSFSPSLSTTPSIIGGVAPIYSESTLGNYRNYHTQEHTHWEATEKRPWYRKNGTESHIATGGVPDNWTYASSWQSGIEQYPPVGTLLGSKTYFRGIGLSLHALIRYT